MSLQSILKLTAAALTLSVAACAAPTTEPVSAAIGPGQSIDLDRPHSTLIPALRTAQAVRWAVGQTPVAAQCQQAWSPSAAPAAAAST